MEDIYKPFLDFLATLYPFALLLLTYMGIELQAKDFKPVVVLCKPFHRLYVRCYKIWNPNASMIQALASLFFLSYIKLIILIGASVSEPHLGSSTRPLSVCQSVSLSVYIYIYHTSVIFGPAAPALRANVSRLI